MPEYLIFPFSDRMMRVHASNQNAARNKYVKKQGHVDEQLVIIPNNFGSITVSDLELKPLYRVPIYKIE